MTGDTAPRQPAAAPVRILVVDDHTILRQGLRSILDLEPDFTVAGEAGTPDEAVTEAARLHPDVVLLDLKLSDSAPAEGLDVCAALRAQQPAVAIVVLTTFLDERLLIGALRRGASGYALKDVDTVELVRIIRTVHGGQTAFDSRSSSLVARSLTGRAVPPAGTFSDRELDVVRRVAGGATNPQVARELYLSESTVKYHLRTAMRKLGARDRTELVYKASASGLLLSGGPPCNPGDGPPYLPGARPMAAPIYRAARHFTFPRAGPVAAAPGGTGSFAHLAASIGAVCAFDPHPGPEQANAFRGVRQGCPGGQGAGSVRADMPGPFGRSAGSDGLILRAGRAGCSGWPGG